MPYSAPHFWLLCLFRSVLSTIANATMVSPLLIDYIKSESRGKAMALASMGLVLGELLMVFMFGFTRKMTMPQQFYVPAFIIAVLSVPMIFMVREPKLKKQRQENQRSAGQDIDDSSMAQFTPRSQS